MIRLVFLLMIIVLAPALQAQDVKRARGGDIEAYIDRFKLRTSDMHGNGWSHYYIPKEMGDTLTVKMSCVYKGMATHAPHTHNEDEAFYIVKGPVNFHINGVERVLQTGDFVYTPSGSSHNIQRVNGTDTIKYLVLKRETTGSVERPHPVSKPDYTFDDCSLYLSADSRWSKSGEATSLLLDKNFSDGFQVSISKAAKGSKVYKADKSARQSAIYIVEGSAEVALDGDKAQLEADNTLYCPKGSTYTLKKKGSPPLVFITVTTF